jgi:hypothetical protein
LARVFISYTHTDREFAARLAVDLTRAAVNVWYDQWEVAPGDSIVEKINNALRWNDYLVIVLSPEAIQSRWVAREINSSLLQSLEGRSVTLIPVLKEQCVLPVLIADLHYADFTQSYDSGFGALLAKFENISQVPAYSVQARKVTDLDIAAPGGPVKTLFPKSFADWPRCVLGEQGQLDVLIILGSTSREKSGDSSEFAKGQIETDVFGIRWRFSRQESPGTTRDAVRAVDLAAYLGAAQLKEHSHPIFGRRAPVLYVRSDCLGPEQSDLFAAGRVRGDALRLYRNSSQSMVADEGDDPCLWYSRDRNASCLVGLDKRV